MLIVCCLFSGDIYIFLSMSSSLVFELFCGELFCVFDTFVILSVNFLSIKLPVASAAFWIVLFKAVLSVSVADCLA